MKFMRCLAFLLLMTPSAFAAEAHFLSGNEYTASPIQGEVTVNCSEGTSVVYTCRDVALDPVSYDYFLGPQGVDADEVTLSSLRADGSRRERTSGYDTASGRSRDAFNLWISTIFQRPLLQAGINKVDYVMKREGQKVAQGTFVVNVHQGSLRECPATHYNSHDSNDCQSQYTVCQRYFEQYQYCR